MADDVVTQQTQLPERFRTRSRAAPTEIEIPERDAATVALFILLDTQWRRHPFTGDRTGLDYAAIRPAADLAGIEMTPDMLPGLRAMEDETLTILAESRK